MFFKTGQMYKIRILPPYPPSPPSLVYPFGIWGRSPIREKDKRKPGKRPRGVDPFRLKRRKQSTFAIKRAIYNSSTNMMGKSTIHMAMLAYYLDEYSRRIIRMQKTWRKVSALVKKIENGRKESIKEV